MTLERQIGRWQPTALWFTPWRFGLLLAGFLFATFPQVFLGAQSFFFRDYGVLGYPVLYHAHESFWRGELPLWNPLSHCGVPFLAQWGTMTLYPFSLIYLLLPLPWSLSLFCFAHLVLGGMGMYVLAERWGKDRLAAAIAGVAFVFNGFTLSCLIWPNYLVALGWMPWVVLLTERAWREGRGRVVPAALIATFQLLSGVPELVLLTWLVVGVLWVADVLGGRGSRGLMSGRLLGVIVLAAGLAAAQLLPFFDLLAHSQREAGSLPVKWAMPGWGWANLLVPLFHCFQTPQGQFFQYGQQFVSSYYLGAGLLGLAAWGAWRVRTVRVWLLGGLALFGLVLALGDQTILYSWLKGVLPVAGLVRYPVKFVALAAFAVPLLAALAVAAIGEKGVLQGTAPTGHPPSLGRSLCLIGLATLVVMAGLAWFAWKHPFPYDQWGVTFRNSLWRAGCLLGLLFLLFVSRGRGGSPSWCQGLAGLGLLVVIAMDAATHSPRQNPTLPARVFASGLWERAFTNQAPRFGQSRLMISRTAEEALLHSAVKEHEKYFMGKRLAEWSNLNLLDGIPKINGASTLVLREQMQVQALLDASTNPPPEGLMDFLGVSQVTTPGKVFEWSARPHGLPFITAGQRPIFTVGSNDLAALGAGDFNGREVVCLPQEVEAQVVARDKVRATVHPQTLTARRLEFDVEAEGAALVVIAQSFYWPWEATVDGQPVALWRANHAFQALEVPAGKHQVIVAYRDRNFRTGAAVSVATLLGCGLYELRRRRLSTPLAL